VFGSLAKDTSDEFSDIDFWVSFDENTLLEIIENRFKIFKEIGAILIFHEAQQNFPLGGVYSLLLFMTEAGPVHVDIYLSPISSARLWGKSKILFNKTGAKIQSGEMVYETKREKRDAQDRVKFVTCMAFNGIKKIARKKDGKFLEFLVEIYNDLLEKSFPEMDVIKNENSFDTVEKVLQNLSKIASKENKVAIEYIQSYFNNVKELYKH